MVQEEHGRPSLLSALQEEAAGLGCFADAMVQEECGRPSLLSALQEEADDLAYFAGTMQKSHARPSLVDSQEAHECPLLELRKRNEPCCSSRAAKEQQRLCPVGFGYAVGVLTQDPMLAQTEESKEVPSHSWELQGLRVGVLVRVLVGIRPPLVELPRILLVGHLVEGKEVVGVLVEVALPLVEEVGVAVEVALLEVVGVLVEVALPLVEEVGILVEVALLEVVGVLVEVALPLVEEVGILVGVAVEVKSPPVELPRILPVGADLVEGK